MSWNTIKALRSLATDKAIKIDTVSEFNSFCNSSIAKEYLKGIENAR